MMNETNLEKNLALKSGRWMPQLLFLLICIWLAACLPSLVQADIPPALSTVNYKGIHLTYDAALAASVVPDTLLPTEDGGLYGWPTPMTLRLAFAGKQLPERAGVNAVDSVAAIYIYNTDEFIALDSNLDQIGQRVRTLQTLLATRPQEILEEIPVLPLLHSGQQFRAHVTYLDFQNGSGVRFLTQFGQEPRPLNNQELYYVFQGITEDGQHYISAFFPINAMPLPATSTMSEAEYAVFIADWENQIPKAAKALAELPAQAFKPALRLVDEMLQSIDMQPD
jgi:hypothetical protein